MDSLSHVAEGEIEEDVKVEVVNPIEIVGVGEVAMVT
jgi:hypothetical protein